MKKKNKGLYKSLLLLTVMPIMLLSIGVTIFAGRGVIGTIYNEVKVELMDMGNTIKSYLDVEYPGDYQLFGTDTLILFKGEAVLNDRFEFLDAVKENTGIEVTLFSDNIRVLSTLMDSEGNRILGTKVNILIEKKVLEEGTEKFYESVLIDGERYFAYYMPLFNEDGACAGMLGVAKTAAYVNAMVLAAVWPIGVIAVLVIAAAAFFCFRFSRKLIHDIEKLQSFMEKVSGGNMYEELDYTIMCRDDELKAMGDSALQMRDSIRRLVELDALTGLYNRGAGEKQYHAMYKKAEENGTAFSIAMADIDYFKQVNDTYGHDGGDVVLKRVAFLLKKHMKGRGFAARWGGEEFLLCFTKSSMEEAAKSIEELLDEVRDCEITYGEEIIRIAMTFGVADFVEADADELIKLADSRLYIGKTGGRNCIITENTLEDKKTEGSD